MSNPRVLAIVAGAAALLAEAPSTQACHRCHRATACPAPVITYSCYPVYSYGSASVSNQTAASPAPHEASLQDTLNKISQDLAAINKDINQIKTNVATLKTRVDMAHPETSPNRAPSPTGDGATTSGRS